MNRFTFTDYATRYTRISKTEARKLFSARKSFYIIAVNMRPGFPFSLGMMIDGARYLDENMEFDSMLANFCYYNANCHETGTYAAFYQTSEL